MADNIFLPFAIVSAQDFLQGCIYGGIKALELQKQAMCINFVTYYVFVTPVAFLAAFYISQNWENELIVNDPGTGTLGLKGLWIGFLVGLTHQIIAYIPLLGKTHWN